MNASQTALRRATRAGCSIPRCASAPPRQWARLASDSARQPAPGRRGGKAVGFAAVFAVAAAGAYYYSEFRGQAESEPEKGGPAKAEFEFEKPRKRPVSKEDNRELISSQHLQVKSSWEHPGVYAWGSNAGKVIDPDSDDKYVKFPRRIAHFNDQLLRGLKLTQYFGAAIAENGDLVQWGTGFSKTDPRPQTTLKGKDLVRLEVSEDRVIALSRGGVVYSIPSSRDDQVNGVKRERETSAWSLWSSGGKEAVSFRTLTPTSLRRGERVTDISSGLEHCLMLTNKGRVFSAASSTTSFPSKGQMGIPTLEWDRRPEGPYDQAHEIMDLRGFEVTQIATGDFHSVVLDKAGRLFSFGENIFGQLGSEVELAMPSM
ncbi:hypothetical protein CDD83_10974 [Cordyceps sp. RAO-2017]|nr:hypothetical protein CDD83_10974 [Cordyceps sp. RAO-2017]